MLKNDKIIKKLGRTGLLGHNLSVLKLPYKKLVLLQTTYLESGKMGPNSVTHGTVFLK